MADILLFSIAEKVLGKLGSLAYKEIVSAWGVKTDLTRLQRTLSHISAVLLDAEERQAENHELQLWVGQLKDVFYQADDVLDKMECEALRRQVLRRYGSITSKVCRFFSRSNPVTFRLKMKDEIKNVTRRLDEIAADRNKFHLVERAIDRSVVHVRREMTHSFVIASEVIGRYNDKEKVVCLLMYPDNVQHISVVSIVGIGGLGKTTLAKLVFNDERVTWSFELKIWICVSDEFDLKLLMVKIIKLATGENCSYMDPDQLQMYLRQNLDGKKFLLVLDDVWNDNLEKWIELRDLLSGAAEGSKILVTTRSPLVASMMSTLPSCDLTGLAEEESLALLLRWAFKEGQKHQYPNLVEIGKDIVKKCGGVPLAVRTLGSLLYLKTDERDWMLVRDSEIWRLEQKENHILPALQLSYNQMPSYLKHCFAACSIFPKDYEFTSFELIQFWMAHGLLQARHENQAQDAEDIGNQYLNELFSRSFLEDFEDAGSFYMFKIHDLAHDLALLVAERECLHIGSHTESISQQVRHLLFSNADFHAQEVKLPSKSTNVRSIMFAAEEEWPTNLSVLETYFSRFKFVRFLDLRYSSFEVLPSSVASLKHLRYLSLQRNYKLRKLPNSICKLQNLQTLRLGGCRKLEDLPRGLKKMVNLRFLAITTQQKILPENGIGCLTSLRFLAISKSDKLETLLQGKHSLTNLRTLLISSCEGLVSFMPFVKHLTSLETLAIIECEKLEFTYESDNQECGSRLRSMIFKELPQMETLPTWLKGSAKSLQFLSIEQCPNFTTFPEWLSSFASLQRLDIIECQKILSLPESMRHLMALKKLRIAKCPVLADRCSFETGVDWPLIEHVPEFLLDQFRCRPFSTTR